MDRLRLPVNRSYSFRGIIIATTTAVSLIILLQGYLKYSSPRDDPYRCQALLHDRAWSPVASDGSRKPEPTDCRTVEYAGDGDPLQHCLQGQRIVFAGDSTMRQVFLAAVERLHSQAPAIIKDVLTGNELHQDLSFEAKGVKVDFIWDPWLNSSALNNALEASHALHLVTDEGVALEKDERSATAIILGAPGLWAARYGGDDYLRLFKRGIDNIKPYISANLDKSIPVSTSNIATQVLLAPVPVPDYGHLSLNRSRTITPKRIDEMNSHLAALPPDQGSHILWVYNQITADGLSQARKLDGLHDSKEVAARKLDVVLNVRCNTASSARSRTFEGTCCVASTRRISILYELATLSWVVLSVCLLPNLYPLTMKYKSLRQVGVIRAARVILFTLVWCRFCDGTRYVGKAERQYQQGSFKKLCLFWALACMASLAKRALPTDEQPPLDDGSSSSQWSIRTPSDMPSTQGSSEQMSDETSKGEAEAMRDPPGYRGPGYLSRDHSDEIKGLMQGFVLLYHYHDASQTLWAYKMIRLFISAYFYLSGYGHTLYLLRTKDFSPHRVASVLFRLNLLSALLPYMMGTAYDLYYFAPAITFWYLVTLAVVSVGRCKNRHPSVFLAKVFAAALGTEWLTTRPDVFEGFSRVMNTVFRMSVNPEELRSRLHLDRYVVFVGMLVAYFVHAASRRRALTLATLGHARPSWTPRRRRALHTLCAVFAVAFLVATQMHEGLDDRHAYDHVHPLVSWVPILCYVVLRTAHPALRDAHLALPAALGRVALETYVLQYHAWLGRDATALLTLGLDARWGRWGRCAEIVLFGTAFFGIAALTHRATDMLARRLTIRCFVVIFLGLWLGNIVLGW
ncbi:10 TM acyl transferase domain found in Cas1p-domain-containing protein [Hypoxylon cercidicola]|nr:10 TM acyl transferase domain found in Cas1p-domain-containing protein [Hypoxylon cercidicola]